ncbi:lipoxygenase homology domain-containing protein 1-like [Talpa occidentalis]|uniref:lipoxygenase homology domain-containing protein 1-like n=1 Tax=Talpa occidentalis TaxID=50954 RepID=UPI0023F86654|nr:lipoxygenase homology domain-containing protein 1-like [Talpa occidentalis]
MWALGFSQFFASSQRAIGDSSSVELVTMQHEKSKKTLDFAANVWLSLIQADADIVCELPVVKGGQAIFPLVRYHVDVHTGQLEQAGTESAVSLCLYGERGDSGLRVLYKSNMPVKFQRGQIDTFQIEAVSLGKLQKVLLHCEASDKSQYWYCEKVVVREPGTTSALVFTCERWLPFMSLGIIHSEIELYLQEMQIDHQPKIQEEANEGDWKVTVVTGDLENAGTTATVSLHVYGETRCSGPIILGSGKHQLFNPNSADIFKINLKDIGEIYKIRIGHDNSGNDPKWYLEEITLENIDTHELFCLTVDSWIPENENEGNIWKEMPIVRINKAPLPGNGWFLESIVVKSEEEDGNQEVLFSCNRWLDEYQDDGKTERELLVQDGKGVPGSLDL